MNQTATDDAGEQPPSSEPATAKPTPTATVESIAGTLIGEKPAPQEGAIAQAEAERVAQADKDVNGQAFNPAIHAANADGSPRKTARGAWALKRGRKGSASATPAAAASAHKGIVVPGGAAAMPIKEQEARAAGAGAANLFLAVMTGIGGQEWMPRIDDKSGMNEKAMLEGAAADYFAAKGWGDLPPGLALTAAVCMYALPRFAMPQTQTRMQKFKIWLGGKIGKWRAARLARKRGMPESDVERAERDARERYQREKRGENSDA